jgi:hypothetical protein
MTTRAFFKDMVVTDTVEACHANPIHRITTTLHFLYLGREVGFATLYDGGSLYCNMEYLPLAIEWLTNNYKHKQWRWISNDYFYKY